MTLRRVILRVFRLGLQLEDLLAGLAAQADLHGALHGLSEGLQALVEAFPKAAWPLAATDTGDAPGEDLNGILLDFNGSLVDFDGSLVDFDGISIGIYSD